MNKLDNTDKSDKWWYEFCIIFLIVATMFVFGILIGAKNCRNFMRADAIKAGAGRFVITNTNTGMANFEWVTSSVGK